MISFIPRGLSSTLFAEPSKKGIIQAFRASKKRKKEGNKKKKMEKRRKKHKNISLKRGKGGKEKYKEEGR